MQRGLGNLTLFSHIHRLKRVAKLLSPVGPDFDKNQRLPIPDNEVNFPKGDTIVAREERIPLRTQKFLGNPLSVSPPYLTTIVSWHACTLPHASTFRQVTLVPVDFR